MLHINISSFSKKMNWIAKPNWPSFFMVKSLYQPTVFLSNGTADWIHRPSAIQRARAAARRDPPTDWSHVHQTTTTRSHLPELRGHFYSKHRAEPPEDIYISPALAPHRGILASSHHRRGGPAIESVGDRTQVSVSSSALAPFRSPQHF